MSDYCCNAYMRELDVDVHRWLPSEILGDIGVVVDTAERRHLAVVEDIAARLTGVLGGSTVERIHHHAVRHLSSAATANSLPRCHTPPAEALPLPFLSNDSGRKLDLAVPLPRFAPARQRPPIANANMPPARRGGGRGTGVFLPRTVAYNGTTSSRPTGGDVNAAGVKPPPPRHSKQQCRTSRQQRRGGDEHEAATARTSRCQLHDLHAHAVATAAAGRPEQPPRRAAGANAAPRLVPGIALPAGMGLLTRLNHA